MNRRTLRLAVAVMVGAHLGAFLAFAAPPSAGGHATDAAVVAMKKGDFQRALDTLRPLAAKGDPDAEFLLGMLYDAGNGVAQDQAIAASWYRKAAEQKHLLAQLFLGVLFYAGQGVEQDYRQAARWLQAPADSGNAQAQFYLGSMYAAGTGVEKDDAEAIRWLAKSAAQRNTSAMGLLATTLFARSRDEQDLIDAYVWSHLAAEYDRVQAMTSARVLIERYCSSEQKQKAKRAIAEWKRRWSNR